MAAGTIVTVATSIPWGQVLEAAPKVADAAVRLWNTITNKNKRDPSEDKELIASPDPGVSELQALTQRLNALEDRVNTLQDQIQDSTEIIKVLAQQNALLVQRVDLNRIRLIRHTVAIGGVIALMAVAIIYLFVRP